MNAVSKLSLALAAVSMTAALTMPSAHASSPYEDIAAPKVYAYCHEGKLTVNALSLNFERPNGAKVAPDLVWFGLNLTLLGNEVVVEREKAQVALGAVVADDSVCASGQPYSTNLEVKLEPGTRLLYARANGHCHFDFWSLIPLPIWGGNGQRTTWYRPRREALVVQGLHGELKSKIAKNQDRFVDRTACGRSGD